jgi:hypothetical protein
MLMCLLTVLTHRWVHLPADDTRGWFHVQQKTGC